MRYPSDQKAKAKQAILQAGARALRTNGFNGIGVDGVAASAGVTSGAFYSNFSNKEALVLLGKLPRAVVRPPLVKIAEAEIGRIKDALIEAGLLGTDTARGRNAA